MLVEAGEQLILVDCGLGTKDMEDGSRLGLPNLLLLNAQSDPTLPAVRQVQKLGFSTKDVRHIICTHLDRDHAGGLPDFPDASIHVMSAERDAVLNPHGLMERQRYRKCHFEHGPKWVTHDLTSNEEWFGVRCIHELPGLPPEIVMVPLNGHSRGHCGVAVDTGSGWVLHCGDAYYVKQELERAPIGVRAFRRMAHAEYFPEPWRPSTRSDWLFATAKGPSRPLRRMTNTNTSAFRRKTRITAGNKMAASTLAQSDAGRVCGRALP